MYWIPLSYLLLAVVFSIAWVGLALGAVLRKMGMRSSGVWIPVLRWVAAAEAGRVSTVAVMTARSVSTLGVAVMLVAFFLRGIQGQDVTNPVAWATLGGIALYFVGAVAGWIMWIIGAGTIALRLNIASGFTVLAALSPALWSAIVGWSKIGTPIPADTIGRAASAGASRSATVVVDPIAFTDSGFPASRDWPAPFPAAPSRETQAPPAPTPLPASIAAVAVTGVTPATASRLSPSPDVDPPALAGDASEVAERAALGAPLPVPPNHPVSPYITALIPPVPHGVAYGIATEASDEETLVEQSGGEDADAQDPPKPAEQVERDTPPVTEVPAPPTPEALDPAAPAPASATNLSLLPPGWIGSQRAPQKLAESAPEPSEEREDHTVIARRRRDVWMLEVVGGDNYPLLDNEVTIGRAAAQALGGSHVGVVDATRTMSKRHAQLRLADGQWKVSDLGSTNGTFVRSDDGREAEVEPGTQVAVQGVLLLGDLEARIVNQGRGR